jgi:hypothetical protein
MRAMVLHEPGAGLTLEERPISSPSWRAAKGGGCSPSPGRATRRRRCRPGSRFVNHEAPWRQAGKPGFSCIIRETFLLRAEGITYFRYISDSPRNTA